MLIYLLFYIFFIYYFDPNDYVDKKKNLCYFISLFY